MAPTSIASSPGMHSFLESGLNGVGTGKPVMTTQPKCGPFTQLVPTLPIIFSNWNLCFLFISGMIPTMSLKATTYWPRTLTTAGTRARPPDQTVKPAPIPTRITSYARNLESVSTKFSAAMVSPTANMEKMRTLMTVGMIMSRRRWYHHSLLTVVAELIIRVDLWKNES